MYRSIPGVRTLRLAEYVRSGLDLFWHLAHAYGSSVGQTVAGSTQSVVPGAFFFRPHVLSSPFFSLSLLVVSQILGHIAGSSPPPHYGSCLAFLSREDFSPFFPRRLASNCAYPRWALSAVDPFFFSANNFKMSPRRDSNSRTNTSSVRE